MFDGNPLRGVLIPIFSLASSSEIGNFGECFYKFINVLNKFKLNALQICPLGPTGYGNSPYQPLSEMALNPFFVDWQYFVNIGLLNKRDLITITSDKSFIDYEKLQHAFSNLWEISYYKFIQQNLNYDNFIEFKNNEKDWLEPFSMFCFFKKKFDNKPWWEWPKNFRFFNRSLIKNLKNFNKKIDFYSFKQWILDKQAHDIHKYAKNHKIRIIGDIPLYVGMDSATVWQNRNLFDWNNGSDRPNKIAGVPPDYFSKNGQLWGNPIYNWEYHKQTNYDWWVKRIFRQLKLCDILRIDHFRGLYNFWAIPYNSKTAKLGKWVTGPKLDFFKKLKANFSNMPFILEDLGLLSNEVREFQNILQIPGMTVIQFAFSDNPLNPYLPNNWPKNTVIYTGTHDNDTTRNWVRNLNHKEILQIKNILKVNNLKQVNVSREIIKYILKNARTQHVILNVQDILNLGSNARINTPGTINNRNWSWKMTKNDLVEFEKRLSQFF